jgi:hypothetical protein
VKPFEQLLFFRSILVLTGMYLLPVAVEGKNKPIYALSIRRMIEPESVFGQIKNNRGFRRFLLRGLPKVNLEVGWISLAHNLLKKAAIDRNREMVVQG